MSGNSDDRVVLSLDADNQVIIHKFGATVISWICNGNEVLFLSSQAVFDNKKAIRGGIPVVFPNFGPWDLGPQHGFARIMTWELENVENNNDEVVAHLTLVHNEHTNMMWDHLFKLNYVVTLSRSDGLTCQLDIMNIGETVFDFTTLLHTYLKIGNVETTSVSNLSGLEYNDKLREGKAFTEDREQVDVSGGADRVYKSTKDSHEVVDASSNRTIRITKSNLHDTVIWNPWEENAKKMTDFGDEEYKQMICVEPGAVAQRETLRPGEHKSFKQNIQVLLS